VKGAKRTLQGQGGGGWMHSENKKKDERGAKHINLVGQRGGEGENKGALQRKKKVVQEIKPKSRKRWSQHREMRERHGGPTLGEEHQKTTIVTENQQKIVGQGV